MIWPPSILKLRIRKLNLWLPLFLLWPLLAVLGLLVMPAACAAYWFRGRREGESGLLFGPRLLAVLCHLRGMSIDVNGSDERVTVVLI